MQTQFLKYIDEIKLIDSQQSVLLGVSGGVDSMVMLNLFERTNYKIGIAHCNFELRDKESDGDEKFVEEVAKSYNIPFYTIRFKTKKYAADNGISIQMAARDLRYEWFEKVRKENDFDLIAIAHHAGDVVETFLTNLTRGTGIKGLTGISPKNGIIIRPLLFAYREDIADYAKVNNILFREDSSNKSTKYFRNYIRYEIIPKFEHLNPDFKRTIIETADRLNETEAIFRNTSNSKIKQIVEKRGEETVISINELKKLKPLKTYLFEILHRYDFSSDNIDNIIKMLNSQSGKIIYSNKYRLLRDRENLIITKLKSKITNDIVMINKHDNKITSPVKCMFKISLLNKNFKLTNNEQIAQLDYHKLTFPLILRKWNHGDSFFPLGMNKKKKLSDFFIDNKLTINQKENTYVLVSDNNIVWIVGYRISNLFKITTATKKIYTVSIQT